MPTRKLVPVVRTVAHPPAAPKRVARAAETPPTADPPPSPPGKKRSRYLNDPTDQAIDLVRTGYFLTVAPSSSFNQNNVVLLFHNTWSSTVTAG